jgi:murein hydrolase activator
MARDRKLDCGTMQREGSRRWTAAIAVMAWAVLALPAGAQTAEPVSPAAPAATQDTAAGSQPPVDDSARNDAAQELEAKQKALELSRQRESNLEAGIELLAKERSQLTEQLVTTAKKVQLSEVDLSGVEERLKELGSKETLLRASLGQQRGVLVKLLAALQRMGRDPPPILITERGDALKMVRSAMQLATVFPPLKDKALVLAKDLAALDATITGIKTQSAQRLVNKERLQEEQVRLDALLQQKRDELESQQGNLEQLRVAVNDQAKSVANLSDLIAKSDRAVAFRGTLGEGDKQLKELQPAPEPDPPAAPAEPVQPEKVAENTTPAGKPVILGKLPSVPGQAFERARGALVIPAKGQRILKFGDPTKNVGRSKGEVYTTRPDAQITSPCNGLVVYAGEFRTFGQILIINAGGGYHILLAGLGKLEAKIGQAVTAGEPVGKMGAGAGSSAVTVNSTPVLYVEFRSRDKPINPAPWWSGEAEKVQG